MNNKRIWFIIVCIVLVIIVFNIHLRYSVSLSSSTNVNDVVDLYNVINLSIGLPGFFSYIDTLSSKDSLKVINNRLSSYSEAIRRLSNDEVIKKEGISSLFTALFFLHDELSGSSVPKSLLEFPLLLKARKSIPKELREGKRPIKESDYYKVFLTKDSINKGKVFISKNLSMLNNIEREYGVLKEYLVAILFIETRLGLVTGNYSVVGIYNALYHVNRKEFLEGFLNRLSSEHKFFAMVLGKLVDISWFNFFSFTFPILFSDNLQEGYFVNIKDEITSYKGFDIDSLLDELEGYIHRRQKWAYNELRSLIIISYNNYIDVYSLRGSWAGAFGMSQFLPSSFLHWAEDANGDGKIDLYNIEDALASTANYLRGHNFNAKSRKLISQSIYGYNHSNVYVDTVVKYASRLR